MKEQIPGHEAPAEQGHAEAEQRSAANRLPRRYRLYDKITEHVSLRGVDTVIIVTALLIVALLVYGIASARPS